MKRQMALPVVVALLLVSAVLLVYAFRGLGTGPRNANANGGGTDTPTLSGRHALHEAAKAGDPAALTRALAEGADPGQPLPATAPPTFARPGATPLILAAESGSLDCVRQLLSAKANPDTTAGDGTSALMAAALSNLAGGPVIDAIADAGAGIDAKDAQGRTALMLAAVGTHEGKVVALLNAGASVNVTDMGGATALALAATGSGAPASATASDTAALKSLLEAGADPNIADSQGVTPLMRAAQRDDVDAVILLLDHGAVATSTTIAGKSALDYAQSLSGVRKVACIGVLKDAGAN